MNTLLVCAATLCAGLAAAPGRAGEPARDHYTAVDLGNLGVGRDAAGTAIDQRARIAGLSTTANNVTVGLLTGPDGRDGHVLGSFGGTFTAARALNARGRVAGVSNLPGDVDNRAFITTDDDYTLLDLGTLGGPGSQANGMNQSGQVVGYAQTADGNAHPFLTGPDGRGMHDLGTLPGGLRGAAHGVNDRGEVAGEASTAEGLVHPFVTGPQGREMRDLGTWGGPLGYAFAINARGQVVGGAMTPSARTLAFITGPHGHGKHRLSDPDDRDTLLVAINDRGRAVGHDAAPRRPDRAIVTAADGRAVVLLDDLVTLPPGVSLMEATAINNRGQIVAGGSDAHVYLLTPAGGP